MIVIIVIILTIVHAFGYLSGFGTVLSNGSQEELTREIESTRNRMAELGMIPNSNKTQSSAPITVTTVISNSNVPTAIASVPSATDTAIPSSPKRPATAPGDR